MEKKDKITILFVNPSSGLSGDTQSLGNLIESLRSQIEPIVLLTEKRAAFDYFCSLGVECLIHPYLIQLEPRFWTKVKNVFPQFWRLRFIKYLRFEYPCLFFVKKTLNGRCVDIVHSNRSQVMMGYRLSNILHIPHVWHVREYAVYGNRRVPGGITRLKRIINSAEARVFVSHPCQESWGLKDENTWTILDAVRSQEDACFETEKMPYILFLSNRIFESKGAGKAVKAFGKSGLFSGYPSVRLKIVGNCDEGYKKKLMTLADHSGCAKFIDFLPAQKDVKPLFAHAMAFVNPSVNEGMGRTTAEAMFFGCPVIAHASGGTLDLVKDGETGYLFNTVDECAELMKKVCTSSQEKIILRAQEFAKQNLSIEEYGEKILKVYKHVIANTRKKDV